MTGAKVHDFSPARVENQARGSTSKNQVASMFSSIMNNSKPDQQMQKMDEVSVKISTKEVSSETRFESLQKRMIQKGLSEQVSDEETSYDEEALMKSLDDIQKEIFRKISEQFGVSVEEIEQAMMSLGFTPIQLTEQNNFLSLMNELNITQNPLEILTNEDLLLKLQNCMQDLKSEFQAMNEIGELLSKQNELSSSSDILTKMFEDLSMIAKEVNPENLVVSEKPLVLEEVVQMKQMVVSTENLESQEELPEDEAILKNPTKEAQQFEQFSGQTGEDTNSESSTKEEQKSIFDEMNIQTTLANETKGTGINSIANPLSNANQMDIIHQINDYLKQNQSFKLTQMEIQLNPENLGNVLINVSTKAGVVSATIQVQNETVKQVMENQMVQLKDSMNQQGIKVEAVEVTIESHEFERNLDERGSDQEAQYEAALKKAQRRIRLMGDETVEELDAFPEEEQLTVEMMRMQGNSLNYTV